MKALRCFSAALRCRRSAEHKGEKKGWSGAAPIPFGSEETTRSTDCSSGGSAAENPGDEAATYEYGISLEDLLAIADDDPPGAVLLDSKSRTYWCVRRIFGGMYVLYGLRNLCTGFLLHGTHVMH